MNILFVTILLCATIIGAFGLDNGLGRTPQMGYNSWYDLMCSDQMNEETIRETAVALVETGLANLGYKYVNLDDCWAEGRDANGVVYPDPNAFPSGMEALAEFVHSLGLKFGVYTDRGNLTCGGRPGSKNYEEIDAKTYANWGVDYVKEDSCYATQDHEAAFAEYATMRDALNATGRPIFFALCGWYSWYAPVGATLGNSWRIDEDDTTWPSIIQNINTDAGLSQYAGPGGWNDPCLLLGSDYSGALSITELQSRGQFSMWAILAAPLLLSQNIRNLSAYQYETYSNIEVIAVDQDPLGIQGIRLAGGDLGNSTNVWGRQLSFGAWALLFINDSPATVDITCDSSCLEPTGFDQQSFNVRDLWAHENIGVFSNSFTAYKVPGNGGCMMIRITPV